MNTLNKSIQPRSEKIKYRVTAINKSGEGHACNTVMAVLKKLYPKKKKYIYAQKDTYF